MGVLPAVALNLLVIALVLSVLYLLRGASTADPGSRRELPSTYDPERYLAGTSPPGKCPHCGAENDPFYRFCRECIAELPAAARAGSGDESMPRRRTRNS